ncbi:hydantoinase/oxoprolinase family protein [Halovivax limisalsi]|uniref:hydantoinase/oxoprolinase family protein n=1 Tax=Halovivax limisalsi TaxID=1453760 RepID=UPI001FFC96B3|nr:hydantoinase/oxoprolinase family protein [Halovivax limisalsi]
MSADIATRIGVDVGGTFTDTVFLDESTGELTIAKSSSTPADYSRGILESIRTVTDDLSQVDFFSHGTTVGVNALLENDLCEMGLLTTAGFRDVLEIGRSNRTNMYDPFYEKPDPLIPRRARLEVDERVDTNGDVVEPLDPDSVREALDGLVDRGVDGVCVALLNAYANPDHERRIGELIEAEYPDLFYTLSSSLSREYREYERTATAAINLGITPVMEDYLDTLEREFAGMGFDDELYIMQSNGGIMSTESAKGSPVNTLKSSLSGGVAGLLTLGETIGRENLIGADMGGTSFDIELVVDGEARTRSSYQVETPTSGDDGYPVMTPTLDVHSIGAGGGSIAWVDDGGGLHVGPRSAGADPGPICYGRGGTEPTVTDANVLLGRLNPDHLLGGDLSLDLAPTRGAFDSLGDNLDMEPLEAAAGILEIANTNMARSIRTNVLRKGIDPREFTMVAFGGAGPTHAVEIAGQIDIPEVLVPNSPGNFSAWGILTTDVKHDYVRTYVDPVAAVEPSTLADAFATLEAEGGDQLADEGIDPSDRRFVRAVDVRYVGQEHTLTVPVPTGELSGADLDAITERFDEAHQEQYMHSAPEEPKEFVSIRLTAFGSMTSPELPSVEAGEETPPEAAFVDERDVHFAETGFVETDIVDRDSLLAGNRLAGPAIVEEDTSTTVVPPWSSLTVDEYGHLRLATGADADGSGAVAIEEIAGETGGDGR